MGILPALTIARTVRLNKRPPVTCLADRLPSLVMRDCHASATPPLTDHGGKALPARTAEDEPDNGERGIGNGIAVSEYGVGKEQLGGEEGKDQTGLHQREREIGQHDDREQ